jgi:hypothetical protein
MVKKVLLAVVCGLLCEPRVGLAGSSRSPADVQPAPVTQSITADELFGTRPRHVQAQLSVTEEFTDNAFNTGNDRERDYRTTVSPGFWASVSGRDQATPSVSTSTTTPGGLALGQAVQESFRPFDPRAAGESFRRFDAFLGYRADWEILARNSSENTLSQTVGGSFGYGLKGGLTGQLVDQLTRSHDPWGTGASTTLDRFYANLLQTILSYDPGGRLALRGHYTNFLVDYDGSRNRARDRTDNSFTGSMFFRIAAKTSAFAEYQFVDVAYDQDVTPDSREHHFFGGLAWEITAKSSGTVRVGYGRKEFEGDSPGDRSDVLFETELSHSFTPKTVVALNAAQKTQETDIPGTDFSISNNFALRYTQRLTPKATGKIHCWVANTNYEGDSQAGGQTKEREDTLYGVTLGLNYGIQRWLNLGVRYSHTRRDSNVSDFEFHTNSADLSLSALF